MNVAQFFALIWQRPGVKPLISICNVTVFIFLMEYFICGQRYRHRSQTLHMSREFSFNRPNSPRILMSLRKWQQYVKNIDLMIVQASSMAGDDSWQPYPIGMGYRFLEGFFNNQRVENPESWQIGPHNKLVLCALSAETDQHRRASPPNRRSIISTLEANGFSNENMDSDHYFAELSNYKFVISPEGNGIDCHRHYEALMAGCIPVVEENEAIQKKYGDCPILYTNESYSDINPKYLQTMYAEMLEQTFDFSALFLSSYNQSMQAAIKANGDYWCERLAGKSWYNATNVI